MSISKQEAFESVKGVIKKFNLADNLVEEPVLLEAPNQIEVKINLDYFNSDPVIADLVVDRILDGLFWNPVDYQYDELDVLYIEIP